MSSAAGPRKRKASRLGGLFAEFKKLSPSLGYEGTEDEARHHWASEKLKKEIKSWKELKSGEIRYLIKQAQEESGDGPAYRALLIARIAAELFGADWDGILRERLMERFRLPTPEALLPAQAHAEIEELLSRMARRDGVDIEAVRARFGSAAASRRFARREQPPDRLTTESVNQFPEVAR